MNAKLTAYALNELPPDERAALEAEMETNPALRVEAEEMRKFCTLLHDEVTDAEKTTLTSEQRFRVLREFTADTQPLPKKTERSIWKHPAFWVPTAIAACTTAMLVITLNEQRSQAPEERVSLAVHAKGKLSTEDVRVNIEKTAKPISAGQTPAPGMPDTPTFVAVNAPVALGKTGDALLPMPTPGTPASPALLLPVSPDGTAASTLVAEALSSTMVTEKAEADFSSASEGSRITGSGSIASRGIAIGSTRPLDQFNFSNDKLSEMPADPTSGTFGSLGGLSPASDIVVGAGGTVSMSGNGLALGLEVNEPAVSFGRDASMASGADINGSTLNLNRSGVVTVNGSLTSRGAVGGTVIANGASTTGDVPTADKAAAGTGGVTKVGAGSITLAGGTLAFTGTTTSAPTGAPANTYTGGTTLAAGSVPALRAEEAETGLHMDSSTPAVAVNTPPSSQAPKPLTRRRVFDTSPGAAPSPSDGGVKLQAAAAEPKPPTELAGRSATPASGPVASPAPADTMTLATLADTDDAIKMPAAGGAPAATTPSTPLTGVPKPASATPAAPAATIANPVPAPAPHFYAIADNENDAYRRTQTTTTTTESLVRGKREQDLEKFGKQLQELKQIKDLQEAETRARKLVTRHAGGETYTPIYENPFLQVAQQPLSTFSIDVDTASYANVRRFLNNGQRPPADAVRLEELINYFPYAYEPPAEDAAPFSVTVDMAEAPWQPMHRLARIALKGREIRKERGAANFVFLVDVSGSMDSPDKLPLVKQSLRMLTEQLKDTDRVAIVTYAGDTGVALTSTTGSERQKIQSAVEALNAGGSTNGAGGIRVAYQQATQNFVQEGVNRVILCTDGDFNVGISSPEELEKLIAEKAKSRVFLSVLGYGTGNLKDRTMETLADKGNGNYAYIDSLSEARKVLVDQMNATLVTIAKDVKIQVEFNPTQVAAYRLLGYENRALAKEDFNNDRKDAGEIGAGHTVTALYEIVPVGARAMSPDGRPAVDDLKYAPKPPPTTVMATPAPGGGSPSRETMTVKLRYKQPEGDKSQLIEVPVTDKEQTMANAPRDFVFAASVTGFGMMLRNSQYSGELTWDMVRDMALRGKGEDPLGYRGEFLQLIDKARGLTEGRE
ncbi:secreted protein with Ig-like and vWFA domain [Roseimicrobium gellanilyticum]|uniref:Secreted protein with Ig-like and vWFA domain n=1 Tax=Roseimicrobium gellanilyticum TaxID=748857 RepID=A0A366HQJ4_9BACT|nr:von Willebrand factor type A domain-containing protein [Roseimicrobium gellanilyticum]RBP44464.1 secreted protein with Ig-like and vWFA domain [Roseimicrobium gellanilyticum]